MKENSLTVMFIYSYFVHIMDIVTVIIFTLFASSYVKIYTYSFSWSAQSAENLA